MLKINKLKPVTIIPVRLNRQIDVYFTQKIFEKYGINRLWKQFGSLVFRRGIKDYEEPGELKKDSIPEVINNHNWYLSEYKPIISILTGRKEPVYLKAIQEKPVLLYIYSDKLLNRPGFSGAITGGNRTPNGIRYTNNTGSAQKVEELKLTREDINYRTVNVNTDLPAANANIIPYNKVLPGNRIMQLKTTTLLRNSYLHTGIINFNGGTKSYYTNYPIVHKAFQYEKAAPLIPGEPPAKVYNAENGKRTPDAYKNTVEPLLLKQQGMQQQNITRYDQVFNYTKFNDVTGFSNHYRISKNMLLQAEETYRKVPGNLFERLERTNIQKNTVLEELYYQAAPLTRSWEKQNREVADGQAHMPTQKNMPGFLPKSKDSGLILYKPKREKPTAAENQLPEEILPGRNEVYTKALTTSARGNKTDIDSPEGLNLIAEKVYGLIEKRLGIQKDRRGIR